LISYIGLQPFHESDIGTNVNQEQDPNLYLRFDVNKNSFKTNTNFNITNNN